MKKILVLSVLGLILLTGCDAGLDPEKVLEGQLNPFRSYKVIEKGVVKTLEQEILKSESESKGLNSDSSAHVIKLTKIGTYAKGEVRILGQLTDKSLNKINKGRYESINNIVNYTCYFEYSYKTGAFTWTSNYPY